MIDRIFTKSFLPTTKRSIGPCSFCQNGNLLINDSKFHYGEDYNSQNHRERANDQYNEEELDWEYDYYTGRFAGLLDCDKCNNKTSISGVTNLEFDIDEDSIDNEAYHMEHCIIGNISPPMKIISFPKSKNFSHRMQTILITSFELFWIDESACANKLRTSIEILLSDLGVKKKDESGRNIFLQKRIEEFKGINSEAADLLMTIKIFGNVGSHSDFAISRNHLLDAYEVLEYTLLEIYEPSNTRILELSNQIRSKYNNQ